MDCDAQWAFRRAQVLYRALENQGGEIFEPFGFEKGLQERPTRSLEHMRLLDCGFGQLEGGCGGGRGGEDAAEAFDAEGSAIAVSLDDAACDDEQARFGFEDLEDRLEGEMSEEPERYGRVAERSGAVMVTEESGQTSCVDVGEEAEVDVEAAEKGGGEDGEVVVVRGFAWGGVCRLIRGLKNGVVDCVGERGDSVGYVDAGQAEELGCVAAQGVLYAGQDGLGSGVGAGNIGE